MHEQNRLKNKSLNSDKEERMQTKRKIRFSIFETLSLTSNRNEVHIVRKKHPGEAHREFFEEEVSFNGANKTFVALLTDYQNMIG